MAGRRRDAGLRVLRLLLPPGGLRREAAPPARELGVPVAPVRVGDGGDVGRGGEPVRAAERRAGVRAVVPAVADGAHGQVLHPPHQRQPAAPRPRPRRRLLQVAAAQGAGHRRHAATPRARPRRMAQPGPRRAPPHPGPRQDDSVPNPGEGSDRAGGRARDAAAQAAIPGIYCRPHVPSY
uniref:CYP90D5 n=1 Tax=Arundo donax TaxID=35708 RepID=A0A0A9HLK2_ARUDO